MKNTFPYLLALCCLCWSCTPETSVTQVELEDPTVPTDRGYRFAGENGFEQGQFARTLGYGIHTTLPTGSDWILHHFILSENEVVVGEGGTFSGTTSSLLITLYGPAELPAGDYPLDRRSSREEHQLAATQLEARLQHDFATNRYSPLLPITSGKVTVSYQDGQLSLDWEGTGYTDDRMLGHYDGPTTALDLREAALTDSELAELPEGVATEMADYPLTTAYWRAPEGGQAPAPGESSTRVLTLTSEPVDVEGVLVGTSDMIQFNISTTGQLRAGRFPLGNLDGYRYELGHRLRGAYLCTNMNFSTRQTDDDFPAATGWVSVRERADGQWEIGFDLVSIRGVSMRGKYIGPAN